MNIPTYNEKVTPGAQSEGVFVSDVLRRTPNRIPTLDKTGKSMSRMGKTLANIGIDMEEAYNAKLLADSQVDTMKKFADLDKQMQDPMWKAQEENHWSKWNDHYSEASGKIINDIEENFGGGRKAKDMALRKAQEYQINYGVRSDTRARSAQVDEHEQDVITKQQDYTELAVGAYMNKQMDALADITQNFSSYLAGQVKSGVMTPQQAQARIDNLNTDVVNGVWTYRTTKPEEAYAAYTELGGLEKLYSKMNSTERLTEEENDLLQEIESTGLGLADVIRYKNQARKTMMDAIKLAEATNKEEQERVEKALKASQNLNVKMFMIRAQNGTMTPEFMTLFDEEYMHGGISEDDYKAVKAISRTTAGKDENKTESKDLLIEAYTMLSRNQKLGEWIENNKKDLKPSTVKDLVKKNADRQYKRGLSVIEQLLKPHPLDTSYAAKRKKGQFIDAVIEYDKLLAAEEDPNVVVNHVKLGRDAAESTDPTLVLTDEQKKLDVILRQTRKLAEQAIPKGLQPMVVQERQRVINEKYITDFNQMIKDTTK